MPDPIKDILRFVIILKWGQALSLIGGKMSLLSALIDLACGNPIEAKIEVAETIVDVATDVADVADDVLDNVPGYEKAKEVIKTGIENKKNRNAIESKGKTNKKAIDDKIEVFETKLEKFDGLIDTMEKKLEIKGQEWNSKNRIQKIASVPQNPLAVLLGNKSLKELLKKNPEDTKIVACGTRGGKTHAHLFDPLPMITWHNMYFEFYDINGNVLYSISGKESYIGKCFNLSIKNANNVVVAEVKEDLVALRTPLIHEWEPHNYSLYVKGRCIGKIKTSFKGPNINKQYKLVIHGKKYVGIRNVVNSKFVVRDLNKNEVFTVNGVSKFTLPLDYCYTMDVKENFSTDEVIAIFSAMLASAFSSQK